MLHSPFFMITYFEKQKNTKICGEKALFPPHNLRFKSAKIATIPFITRSNFTLYTFKIIRLTNKIAYLR